MPSTTATKVDIPAGTWNLDKVHSSAAFEVEHNGFSLFRTGFDEVDATLVSGDDGVELTGSVETSSVDIDDPDFKAHLLSPEFFDADRHPRIHFRSSDLTVEDGELVLHGELEVGGTAKPVEARGALRGPIADAFGGERVSLSLETVVDRHEFGIGWNMDLPSGGKVLGDDVKLIVALELAKG